jgi:hypothetical protein
MEVIANNSAPKKKIYVSEKEKFKITMENNTFSLIMHWRSSGVGDPRTPRIWLS